MKQRGIKHARFVTSTVTLNTLSHYTKKWTSAVITPNLFLAPTHQRHHHKPPCFSTFTASLPGLYSERTIKRYI